MGLQCKWLFRLLLMLQLLLVAVALDTLQFVLFSGHVEVLFMLPLVQHLLLRLHGPHAEQHLQFFVGCCCPAAAAFTRMNS